MPQISICGSPETEPPEPLETRTLVVRRIFDEGQHPAYASAIAELKQTGELGRRCRFRTAPYLNNVIEQDHRFIKKRITRASAFDRWRVPVEPSRATRRCMQSAKVRSDGSPRAILSRNASSSIQ